MQIIPSTFGSAATSSRAAPYRSLSASPSTSTGFTALAASGSTSLIFWIVSLSKRARRIPLCSSMSVARMPGPPAFVIIATRSPLSSGWLANARPLSNNSCSESMRSTPDWENAAS